MPDLPYYDVFISYAREEYDWVEKHLYEPLTRCRRKNGEQPHIFLDKDSIALSARWRIEIAEAIETSRKIIGVFSRRFFASSSCEWEWLMAINLEERRRGKQNLLCPVLKDPLEPESYLPLWIQEKQFVDLHQQQNWFAAVQSQ